MVNKGLTIVKFGTDTVHNVNIILSRNKKQQGNKKIPKT